LFCLAMPILWGERRYLLVLVYAVLFPIAIYLLFSQLLQVRFPAGSFTSLLG
jgi:putative tricarboxylic transport membrane protein